MGTTMKLLYLMAMVVASHSSAIHTACALPYEAGPCFNYTVRWYYDIQYGACSRFHYGGCEGNRNRFADKAECDNVCVHPTGKDVCNLPKVSGSCGDQVTRWYHDTNQGCVQFTYGGCLGNANNFETLELCEKQCVPELNQAPCALPYEAGPCDHYTVQWYYDMQYGACSRFHYGGCEGNRNRFADKAECDNVCVHPTGKDVCNLPKVSGSCGDQVTRWYHDTNQGCVQFTYGGCLGNANNFETLELCEKQCVPELNPDAACTRTAATTTTSSPRRSAQPATPPVTPATLLLRQ